MPDSKAAMQRLLQVKQHQLNVCIDAIAFSPLKFQNGALFDLRMKVRKELEGEITVLKRFLEMAEKFERATQLRNAFRMCVQMRSAGINCHVSQGGNIVINPENTVRYGK